jgi:molybdate transport system ATP-binding protein
MSFEIDVEKRLGDALVSLKLEAGEGATVLFGPSGVGKSSILNMVAGLLRPDRGHIVVDGETLFGEGIDLSPEKRRAGYVFQEARLFPHKRVRANLLYGVRGEAEGFEETIRFLGIGHLLDRWPRTLSGGEAQRVAIGRALLSKPRFLLLDEPLSSLDRARREEISTAILYVRDVVRMPILMVTHDLAEADRIGNRIVRM